MNNVINLNMPENDKEEPDFIKRKRFVDMKEDDQTSFLNAIRDRRMRSYSVHRKTLNDLVTNRTVKFEDKIRKKADQVEKKIAAADKALTALEKAVYELRLLRIEGGLS